MQQPPTPASIEELLHRSQALAGFTLGELAQQYHIQTPENLKREKGWVGQLLEWILGACAGSKPEQDFQHLHVEMKTLPISKNGTPLETTFVCTAPLTGITGEEWKKSHFYNKLRCVLWVPILAERQIPLTQRMIGSPFLWHLTGEDEQILKQDWEELMSMIALGDIGQITGKHGEYLQIRPKAANSSALTDAIDAEGNPTKALPRGFYLRTQFTKRLLESRFGK